MATEYNRPKWEYYTESFMVRSYNGGALDYLGKMKLNQLGVEGWEVVSERLYENSALGDFCTLTLLFKRPIE